MPQDRRLDGQQFRQRLTRQVRADEHRTQPSDPRLPRDVAVQCRRRRAVELHQRMTQRLHQLAALRRERTRERRLNDPLDGSGSDECLDAAGQRAPL